MNRFENIYCFGDLLARWRHLIQISSQRKKKDCEQTSEFKDDWITNEYLISTRILIQMLLVFFYRVIDQILSYISSFDLNGLLSLWSHLNSRLFRRLDPTQTGAVGRLESGIMKLYLGIYSQTSLPPVKCTRFFLFFSKCYTKSELW